VLEVGVGSAHQNPVPNGGGLSHPKGRMGQ
jgi:hypothetical protein